MIWHKAPLQLLVSACSLKSSYYCASLHIASDYFYRAKLENSYFMQSDPKNLKPSCGRHNSMELQLIDFFFFFFSLFNLDTVTNKYEYSFVLL